MFNNETAVEKPLIQSEDRKVEVGIEDDTAVIRLSTYADGLGWFVQKTIKIDADMLDLLVDDLTEARGRIKRDSDEILSASVLEY